MSFGNDNSRYRGIAITMVDHDVTITAVVQFKYIPIAIVSPPLTQLPVPLTRKYMEELLVSHAQQCVKILISEVSLEVQLVTQATDCS